MRERRRYQWGISGILAILLVWGMMVVSAEPVPDLKGSWDGISVVQYSPSDGFINRTSDQGSYQIINQDGRAFVGDETYYNPGTAADVTELFAGALSPDGRTFVIDEEGSGITFGELVSDHELYNYMFFLDRGPMVIVSHLVKSGTDISPVKPIPDLIGAWNLTHAWRNGAINTGLLTINEQQGRIWGGAQQISDENGTMIESPVVGTIGDTGSLYAVSRDGAFMFGSLTGDETIDCAVVIPGDPNGTFVGNEWMTRNETTIPESDLSYQDLTGDWKIDNRKVIQGGKITEEGPVSGEWISYSNQTGRFFTAIRHNQDTKSPQTMVSSAIFRSPDEIYLTNADSAVVLYHILDNSSMEAIVNRKDGKSSLFMDLLTRK